MCQNKHTAILKNQVSPGLKLRKQLAILSEYFLINSKIHLFFFALLDGANRVPTSILSEKIYLFAF